MNFDFKDPNVLAGILVFVLLGVLGWLLVSATRNHRQTLPFQLKMFAYAFALRFAVSIILYAFGLSSVIGDEDSSGWSLGFYFYTEWKKISFFDIPSSVMAAYSQHHVGYYYLTGLLFLFTDSPGRLPAAALNCFFGALTVVFAYRAAITLFSQKVAENVAWWTCLFPSMIIWSAQTVKEPVVILLEIVALYCCLRLKVLGFSLRDILLCGLATVLVIPFRFYAAYVIAAAVALTLILPQFGKRKLRLGSVILLAGIIIPIVAMSGALARHEREFESFDLKFVQKFRTNVAVGNLGVGSGVETNYDLQTPTGLGLAVVVGAAHLMLAPFPWQLGGGSLRMALALPELLVWWWLFFVGVVPGFWYCIRKRFSEVQPILFFIVGLGLLYSLMFGNVGLVFRQRAQLLPWLFIFAAVGMERRWMKRLEKQRAQQEATLNFPLPANGAVNPADVANFSSKP
jgi:4-amino-4-deoxy-L-arabinose transferase-like glycosyltransferase